MQFTLRFFGGLTVLTVIGGVSWGADSGCAIPILESPFGGMMSADSTGPGCRTVDTVFGNLHLGPSSVLPTTIMASSLVPEFATQSVFGGAAQLDTLAENVAASLQTPRSNFAMSANTETPFSPVYSVNAENFNVSNASFASVSGPDFGGASLATASFGMSCCTESQFGGQQPATFAAFEPGAFVAAVIAFPVITSPGITSLNSTSFNNSGFDAFASENPEPSTFILMGTALILLGFFMRRRRVRS